MQNELEDHQEDYKSLTHEEWCDPLSKINVKDKSNRAATQINNIASARAASISDKDKYIRIMMKKKSIPGILCSNKGPHKKLHKHHGTQHYSVIFKKAGMTQREYMSHISEDYTGVHTNRTIKD